MRQLFAIIILCSLSSQLQAQKSPFKPFTLIVLQPDTVIVDKSFNDDIDKMQADYLRQYYTHIQQLEVMVNTRLTTSATDKKMLAAAKQELADAKASEEKAKQFKYYQVLSSYSVGTYHFYFNEYEPYSTIIELPKQKTAIAALKKLADSAKADYIIFFSNVHTAVKDGSPILKLTTSLYSKKTNTIILQKETEGDTNSEGGQWTCSGLLQCLLVNGVRTSTDAVVPMIAKERTIN